MSSGGHSDVAVAVQRFFDWAHSMGWCYGKAPYCLRHFACFLQSRGVHNLADVDAALLLQYRTALAATRSPATVNGYLKSLRALWRYLHRDDLVAIDIAKTINYLRVDHFVPYLYEAQELARIEATANTMVAQARRPTERFARQTLRAVFVLLRDCGLRISEACRLNIDNYDHAMRSLRIERTKFFKTRTIPLPRSTCTQLQEYLQARQLVVANTADPRALFLTVQKRSLRPGYVHELFKRMLCSLNLYQPRRRDGRTVFGSTNIHALRHGFAVRTLTRWRLENLDVERLLPLLSAYMGHACVSYTKHYLHLTPTLAKLASKDFRDMALPRLDGCTTVNDDE